MGIRTFRRNDRAGETLAEPRARLGLSISARDKTGETPYAVFRWLDLGPGGYAREGRNRRCDRREAQAMIPVGTGCAVRPAEGYRERCVGHGRRLATFYATG